jgi:hypothetical protein
LDSNTKVREFETTTQEVLPDEDDSYEIVVTTRIQRVTTTTRVPRKLPDERARPLHDELKKAQEHSLNSPLKIIGVTSDRVDFPAHARHGAVASSSATHARDNPATCYKESKAPQLSSLGTLAGDESESAQQKNKIAAAEEAGLDSAGVLSQDTEKINKVDSQRNHSENCCTLPQTQGCKDTLKALLVLEQEKVLASKEASGTSIGASGSSKEPYIREVSSEDRPRKMLASAADRLEQDALRRGYEASSSQRAKEASAPGSSKEAYIQAASTFSGSSPCTPNQIALSTVEALRNWRQYAVEGRKYYHNAATNTTQWKPPQGWPKRDGGRRCGQSLFSRCLFSRCLSPFAEFYSHFIRLSIAVCAVGFWLD